MWNYDLLIKTYTLKIKNGYNNTPMNRRLKVLLLIACSIIYCVNTIQASNNDIVILYSDDLTSTKRTIKGASKVILREYPNIVFTNILVKNKSGQDLSAIETIESINPKLILTIGSIATKLAQNNFTDIPIVFSSVKYPVLSGFVNSVAKPGKNITGASIDIPTQIQFEKFKQIIPDLKK